VGSREIDIDERSFEGQMALLADRVSVLSLDRALDGSGRGGVVVTIDDGYRDFHDHVLPALERYRIPAVLYLATGLVSDGEERLTWSMLAEAVETGLVTVGAHTHSHLPLGKLPEGDAHEEMRRSKELIEDRLGVPCRHFAYPFGVSGPGAERAARRLFDSAALGWGTNRGGRLDPFRLARLPVLRSDGFAFFRAKARGLLDGEALVYRLLRRGPWRAV
jgi:peptidoglycan/xylan/chitin deacetylase (PgdA/CDA1 family)